MRPYNARTGQLSDCVDNINLDRYVDMPYDDFCMSDIQPRANNDSHVNSFGHQLLTLCKENNVNIVNGRLTPGNCTYHGHYRNRSISSTVDYLITHYNKFGSLCNVHIFDITEFSDHCPLTFSLKCNMNSNVNNCYKYTDKIVWNTDNVDSFLNYLN